MLLVLLQANMFQKFSSQRINKDRNTIKIRQSYKDKGRNTRKPKGRNVTKPTLVRLCFSF